MGEPLPKPAGLTPPIEEAKDSKDTKPINRKCFGCRRRVRRAPERNLTDEEKERVKGDQKRMERLLLKRIPYTKNPPCRYCSKAFCDDCIEGHAATHGSKASRKTSM